MRRLILWVGILAVAGALLLAFVAVRDKDVGPIQPTASARPRPDAAEPGLTPSDPAPRADGPQARLGRTGTSSATPPTPTASSTRGHAVQVAGRVVDARGVPVGNARVYAAPSDRTEGVPLENLDPRELAWGRRTDALTDALGHFETPSISAASLRIAIRAAGFAPYDGMVSTPLSVVELGDVVLADSVVLAGRVLDRAGQPIAGAVLRRLELGAHAAVILGEWAGDAVATTAADGTFRVDELRSGPWMILIKAEGHPDKLAQGETKAPGQIVSGLDIQLEDGAEIRGRVVQAPPEALSELWVRTVFKTSVTPRVTYGVSPDQPLSLDVPKGARCAPDGSFVVRGLTPGTTYQVSARAGEHDFFGPTRTTSVEARAGQRGVELVYTPPTSLVFRVVDASSSEPVTEFEAHFGGRYMQALTDAGGHVRRSFPEGRARFENVLNPRDGEATELMIDAVGFQTLRVAGVRPIEGHEIDLGTLKLERAPMVVVHVLDDATNRPVQSARVTWAGTSIAPSARGANGRESDGATSTDADGLARLNRVRGTRAALVVRHPDYALSWIDMTDADEANRDEIVRLKAGGSVIVEVLDAAGAPVRGARIRHEAPRTGAGVLDARSNDETRTDARGKLLFAHLEAGEHRFGVDDRNASSSGDAARADRRDSERAVAVVDFQEQAVTLIVPRRARLTGRVTEAGQSVSGATLRFAPSGTPPSSSLAGADGLGARTNGRGEYALDGIDLGTYRVSVVHPARAMAFESEAHIAEFQSKLDLDLPTTTIEGRLVDEENRTVTGLRVRVKRVPEGSRTNDVAGARVYSDAEGHFALRGVQSDVDLIVTTQGGDYQLAQSDIVRVTAGATKSNVDLKLVLGCLLEVRVAHPDGRNGSACRVRADFGEIPSTNAVSLVEICDTTGVAHFRGLRAGQWRVRVESCANDNVQDRAPTPDQVVAVERGATNRATLELH